ncbi:hypothetical protein, partial [Prevotella pectinovora]|uniref:hypothetical protein n=1 Tax=Prevotella pectinovora TaxID=1602169 RepID=UPI003080E526
RPQPWQGCALPTELFPQKPCKDIGIYRNIQKTNRITPAYLEILTHYSIKSLNFRKFQLGNH